jgi:hypothetical protein
MACTRLPPQTSSAKREGFRHDIAEAAAEQCCVLADESRAVLQTFGLRHLLGRVDHKIDDRPDQFDANLKASGEPVQNVISVPVAERIPALKVECQGAEDDEDPEHGASASWSNERLHEMRRACDKWCRLACRSRAIHASSCVAVVATVEVAEDEGARAHAARRQRGGCTNSAGFFCSKAPLPARADERSPEEDDRVVAQGNQAASLTGRGDAGMRAVVRGLSVEPAPY